MNKMNIVGRILSYLVPFKKRILFAVIILIIAISIGFLQPLVIQRITDIGMVQKNMNAIFQAAVFLGFLVILNQLIEMLQTKIFVEIVFNTSSCAKKTSGSMKQKSNSEVRFCRRFI